MAHTSSHPLVEGLNALRCAGKFTDVTLIVQGQRFRAHRIILSACSDYFCAMFSDGMMESRMEEIPLLGVSSARAISAIIEYIYTAKLELNIDNVEEMLAAATHIQLNCVVASCVEFLEKHLDAENCVDIAILSDRYAQDKLKRKAYRYICAHLKELSVTPEFLNLKYDGMRYMLASNLPVDITEFKLLTLTMNWCMRTNLSDYELISDLIDFIRFEEISKEEWNELRQQLQQPFDGNCGSDTDISWTKLSSFCSRLFPDRCKMPLWRDLVCDNQLDAPNRKPAGLINMRGMELALLKVGGFEADGLTNDILTFSPSSKKWRKLTEIPHIDQCNYGTAVLNNTLYVVGGSYDICLNEYIHPFGFRYSPLRDVWNTIAPIQSERCRFSLNAVGTNYLYAVGGVEESLNTNSSDDLAQVVSNVERYDVVKNIWTYMPCLTENRSQHAGAAVGKHLYISGGFNLSRNILSSFWSFDTETNNWSPLSPMLSARCDHVLVVYNNHIYACGGWHETINETRELVNTIEVYDIDRDIWRNETIVPAPAFYSGIAALNDTIYFVGGLLSNETINRATSKTLTYNITTNTWQAHKDFETPRDVWESACEAMYLSKPLDVT